MGNAQLSVLIDGREALPVRAIPFVTDWSLPPHELVDRLARDAQYSPKLLRNICAYRLADGMETPVPLAEWRNLRDSLQTMSEEIGANFERPARARQEWENRSLALLPPGAFFWLDEFALEWQCNQDSFRKEDDSSWLADLTLAIDLDSHTLRKIMMGFEKTASITPNKMRMKWGRQELETLRQESNQLGITQEHLAKKYGVTRQHISKLLKKAKPRRSGEPRSAKAAKDGNWLTDPTVRK